MDWTRWMAIAIVTMGANARAAEEGDAPVRPGALAASKSAELALQVAPFSARVDPMRSMLRAEAAAASRALPCTDGLTLVCYDARERGVVYRGARGYMPRVQGLTPEGVAVRHDRIILRYSF